MGIILYAVCLPIQAMTGFSISFIILVFGIVVAFYTVLGGLEAVIWTDAIQGAMLIVGGLVCLPLILMKLPGGMGQIIEVAQADGKFGIGSTALSLSEKTVWVMILTHVFHYTQMMCTDQTVVQRYCAMRSDKEARHGVILGTMLTIPVWVYFTFIGTALYVFYKAFPKPELNGMVAEQILPFFILTEAPAGIAGFIISGLIAAAMSTLSSIINASAATVSTDFYRRLFVKDRTEQHYLNVGRLLSLFFSIMMISLAILIHLTRTTALVDLQQTFIAIVSGGLLGLFLLGFVTKRVDNVSAIVATICTVLGICVWMVFDSSWAAEHFPRISKSVPDKFWINVVSNIVLFCLGYFITLFFRRTCSKDLKNLTVWTLKE